MKKIIILLLLFLGTIGYSQNWNSSFVEAQRKAVTEDKNILLIFSGSDWCAPCIKLDKTIWQSEEFNKESTENWILYKADFPKKKANLLSLELTAENKKIAERYNKEGNFPLVLLLDPSGKVLGITGYKNVTPQEYIQIIHSFEKK